LRSNHLLDPTLNVLLLREKIMQIPVEVPHLNVFQSPKGTTSLPTSEDFKPVRVDGVIYSLPASEIRQRLDDLIHCKDTNATRQTTFFFNDADLWALLPQVRIAPVFWGNAWNDGVHPSPQNVWNTLNTLVSSPYLSFLDQYVIQGEFYTHPYQNAFLLPPFLVTSAWSALGVYGARFSQDIDAQGHAIFLPGDPLPSVSKWDVFLLTRIVLQELRMNKTIPDPLVSPTLVMIFTPRGITNEVGAPGYHSSGQVTIYNRTAHGSVETALLPFAVVGLVRYTPDKAMDDLTEVFSHELAEAVSNPFGQGVRLLPEVQAARELSDQENELGDFAQDNDPQPFRRMANGLSVSSYWSDWHGAGVVPERYPYPNEFHPQAKGCPDDGLVNRYINKLEEWLITHAGDAGPAQKVIQQAVLAAVRRQDLSILSGLDLVPSSPEESRALSAAADHLAVVQQVSITG
jgi:hypothetical protein